MPFPVNLLDTVHGCTCIASGGMSERFKEAVLKTVVVHATVGSNPTPSERTGEVPERPKGAVC